jgi:N-acetylglucosamine malate deacetylase 2
VLAVCAHPDDESFGLGALLDRFARQGSVTAVVCFTHGEASTLGTAVADLHETRRVELSSAAAALGIGSVELWGHPDGSLTSVGLDRLAETVADAARRTAADLLVVFDEHGVTGHPDHCRATEAALVGAPALPVLAWTVPLQVADALNAELGTRFVGRGAHEIDLVLTVDREAQRRAIACHASQCDGNTVLRRRLELSGDREWLRWLRRPDVRRGA